MDRLPRTPNLLRYLTTSFHAYHWWGVVAFTVITLVLAYEGIRGYCDEVPSASICLEELRPLDVLYLSVQLFTWESGSLFLGEHVPWSLQAARLLAPILLGYTALRALLVLFADQLQFVRAGFSWNHVVICGLGARGLTLAAGFRAAGWRVVILESDQHNRFLTSARLHGAVLTGDGTDQRALLQTGIRRARHLVAVCGSDAMDAEVAAQAMALVSGRKRVLTCHVHVADPILWERLRVRELVPSRNGQSRLQFFNTFDMTARAVASIVFPPRASADEPAHLLLAGFGPVGERLIVHACRIWLLTRTVMGARLRITVIDEDATRKVGAMARRYPRLGEACDFVVSDRSIASPEFEHEVVLAGSVDRVTAACVTASDDAKALAAGLAIFYETRGETFPVVVCATQEQGLDLFLADMNITPPHGRLMVFGTREQGCTPELLLENANETLARAIHDEYCRDQARVGQTIYTNAAMRFWEELPEALRDSNRRQADHIVRTLEEAGCVVAPLTEWDETPMEFEHREIECMARTEHTRWVNERWDHGWRPVLGPKNIERKRNPHLISWESLPEDIRDIDRNTVREIPAFLARVGLGVYRRPSLPGSGTSLG